jgi:(R,R)-butanediol dehydrogenase / meso-butanediol dehydrogenase / diacetyl reductase
VTFEGGSGREDAVGATMRAARWHGRRDVRVEEVPVPRPGPVDLLLRVRWCGICGTDLEEYRDGPVVIPTEVPNPLTGQRAPVTLGHEFAGEVVETGAEVSGFARGDRVVPDIALFCGTCHHCRRHEYALCLSWATIGLHGDGGLAEYARVPARLCQRLPDTIPDDDAALIETVEVAVRAVRRGGVGLGDSVAVVGDGAVGLIGCQVARAAGATRIVLLGHRPARLEMGRRLGVDAALDTTHPGWQDGLLDLTDGLGADVALECGGRAQAIDDAIVATRKGGRIVLLAVLGTRVPVDTWAIVAGERTLTGSVQHHFDEDLPVAIDLVATGRVSVRPLITRRIPLERIVSDGFATLEAGGPDIKVLVETRPD